MKTFMINSELISMKTFMIILKTNLIKDFRYQKKNYVNKFSLLKI